MSRTTNSQNALVNLLRPTITYDSGVGFIPKLVLSNIDVLTANQIVTDNFQFGGVGGNVFIGSNVGGGTGNSNNVGIGVSALAGATLTTGTVAIGYNALQSASNVSNSVGIGTGVVGGGVSNVIVGANAGTTGICNVIVGAGMNAGNSSNKLYIGTGGISNTTIGGDLQLRRVGIATSDPQTTLDVSGTTYIREYLGVGVYPPQAHIHTNGLIYATSGFRAQGGSATEPAFSFIDDSGTGFYQISNGFAITNKGVEQVLIQDASFGIRGDLWVSGSVNISGTGAVNQTIQGYIRLPSSTNPTIDISGDSIRVDGYVKAGGSLRTDGSIRVGPFASPTVDISGSTVSAATLRGTTATITPIVRDATVPSGFDLSGGSLRLASNVELTAGFVRSTAGGFRVGPLLAPTTDISSGNIRLTGHLDISTGTAGRPSLGFVTDGSSGIHSGGTSILAFDTSGIQRMTLSNGNLGIGKATPVVALEVVGDVSATTYNGPGGTAGAPHYTFSDDRTTGLFFPGNNIVGFTAGGTERMRISNANIGIGTTAPTTALHISGGVVRITGPSGEITFSNGTINTGIGINISGTPVVAPNGSFSNAASTSNSIGGVVLSNSNAIVGGFLRNALTPSQFDISGGNISNSGTQTSSNFVGTASASNSIGGVTLSNTTLASATIRNATTGFTIDMSGGNISNSGTHTSSNFVGTASASNSIGGVTLSNTTLVATTLRNATTGFTIDMSGGNISNSGTHTSSNFIGTTSASNRIGGVTLSNTDICLGGTITFTSTDTTKIHLLPATSVGTTGPRIAHAGGWNTQFFAGASTQPDPTGIFTFNTSISGSTVERMRIVSNGNVGIGRPDPTFTLDVSGSARISNSSLTITRDATALPGQTHMIFRSSNNARFSVNLGPAETGSGNGGSDLLFHTHNDAGGLLNSNALTIQRSSGNVGIGIAAPESLLHVSRSGTGVSANVMFSAGDNGSASSTNNVSMVFRVRGSGGGDVSSGLVYNLDAGNYGLSFVQGSTSRMRITTGGSVGIGTTNPQWALDVSSTAGGTTGIFRNSATNGQASIVVSGNGVTDALGLQLFHNNATQGLYNNNTLPFVISTSNTERLRILSSGSVGIGRSDPGTLLDVAGDVRANGGTSAGYGAIKIQGGFAENVMLIQDVCTTNLYSSFSTMGGWFLGTKNNLYGTDGRTFKLYRINSNATPSAPAMVVTTDGSVGIATSTPAYRLDVNGTIRGSSNIVAVASSNWQVGSTATTNDTSLTLQYTPKQSSAANVTLLVNSGVEMWLAVGTGFDGGVYEIRNNATVLTQHKFRNFDQVVDSRTDNVFGNGNVSTVNVSGSVTSAINMRIYRTGDDSVSYRNAYIVISELSTT